MNGYNDKLSVLVRHVLEKVKGVVVNPKRLEVIKDEVCTILHLGKSWPYDNNYLGPSRMAEFLLGPVILSFRLLRSVHHGRMPMDN